MSCLNRTKSQKPSKFYSQILLDFYGSHHFFEKRASDLPNKLQWIFISINQQKRRFFQLQALISFYVPDFDDRKIWFYGCNCLMDNDRPMSAPGYGKPTDRNGFIS